LINNVKGEFRIRKQERVNERINYKD